QMAQELADSWETKPKILVSSPLKRAQETMAPLAKKFQLPVRTDQRVIEAGNKFQGLSDVRRRLRNPKLWPLIINPDRKSTRLNSSHVSISYAVFCLKKK